MKLRKMLAIVTVFAMMFSLFSLLSLAASANETTAWFKFDARSGGWIVNDLSRAANGGGLGGSDHGHRVQIVPNNIEAFDLPISGFEVLLYLPPLPCPDEKDEDGNPIDLGFRAIREVQVTYDIDWTKWTDPEARNNFEIITQTAISDWREERVGGNVGEILRAAGVTEEDELNPNFDWSTVNRRATMTTNTPGSAPLMWSMTPGGIKYTDFFKVIVTNFTRTGGKDPSPVTATVHLIGYDGHVIPLLCPDCKQTTCICLCPTGCGKTIIACECFCDKCQAAPCKCCDVCREPVCVCVVVSDTTPPPPPELHEPPQGKQYKVLEAFGTWTGSGSIRVRIDADHEDFEKLVLGANTIANTHYTVTKGSTVITLNEAYLKSLSNGTHNFVAEFKDGFTANIPLIVNSSTARPPDSNPRTGITVAFVPVAIAAAATIAATRRRKRK
jgi:hypothetical protein